MITPYRPTWAYGELDAALTWMAEMREWRVSGVMAQLNSEGRLCELKPSDWAMLLVGVVDAGLQPF